MDFELRKKYIDKLQKETTSICFNNCFNDSKLDKNCYELCNLNFFETCSIINKKFKKILKDNYSIYYFKLYNKENLLYSKLKYSDSFIPYKYGSPNFYLAKDDNQNKK